MIDLEKTWPLGLNRRTWPRYLLALLLLMVGLLLIDASASQAAILWPAPIREFFEAITDYGLSDWILIPSLTVMLLAFGAVFALPRRLWKRAAWEIYGIAAFIFVAVGLPGLVANLIKRIVGRGRPELFADVGPFDFHSFANSYTYESFPSGHATTSIAFAFVIGFLWPRAFPLVLLAAVAVCFSRIPVGMHYPSDVLGGLVLGTLGAYAIRNLFATRRFVFKPRSDGHVVQRPLAACHRLLRRRQPAR